jgi:hypothetical protein
MDILYDNPQQPYDNSQVMCDNSHVLSDNSQIYWDNVGSCQTILGSCQTQVGSCQTYIGSCQTHVGSCQTKQLFCPIVVGVVSFKLMVAGSCQTGLETAEEALARRTTGISYYNLSCTMSFALITIFNVGYRYSKLITGNIDRCPPT